MSDSLPWSERPARVAGRFPKEAATSDGSLGQSSRATGRQAWPARPDAVTLAELAVQALLDEATLTPKPGLVDLRGRGSHTDIHIGLMCVSANALRPGLEAMALAGAADWRDLRVLRERLGLLGRATESAMMAATEGVNTHRGAIWALGLLVAAANMPSRCGGFRPATIAKRAGAIASQPDRFAGDPATHKGGRACAQYGVAGARGQAQAGFPHVLQYGLPTLHASRRQGAEESCARLDALMAILAKLDDTCVLARGGPHALRSLQDAAANILKAGGTATCRGKQLLNHMDSEALRLGVSPGGAADLLAATLFLDSLTV
ncbi:triphosphoribosyl-dephospho-CoA synthase [Pigmentiphaga aceris]|uniref:Probable 2-(5''-triphosphoribosyl)-3'-dephosphocoenzyme-A synthase n=1 Tax=Pigmentiphaga aceris TaxID=1940612 RepID=A0A5C0B311_9BURK|nr:triphosphoribosyl-dephospho-CoA synthase [Pigmentiphaga aceris]QEI07590.1 triphosphoribosyl-dephospho-CoA synthase [Pigmentiphaga aceris]